MTAAVIITGSILGLIGIGFSIWSLIDTRKRYYEKRTKENTAQKIKSPIYLAIL